MLITKLALIVTDDHARHKRAWQAAVAEYCHAIFSVVWYASVITVANIDLETAAAFMNSTFIIA